jgi:hypothetical protein
MNKYNCERCGFHTDLRGNFKRHVFRKNVCKPKLNDINIEEIRNKYGFQNVNPMSTQCQPYGKKMSTQCQPILDKLSTLNTKKNNLKSKSISPKNNPTCKYCNKIFKSRQVKSKHENKYCKIKKQQEENSFKNILIEKENLQNILLEKDKNKDKEIESLQNILLEKEKENKEIKNEMENKIKEIKEEMRKQIEVLLEKVGNNITVNNNIQLNNYGNENLDHITSDFLKKLIETPYKSIPMLIENIHFNKKYPENKNVRITNKKLPFAEVFKDDGWKLCNKTEVVNEMVTTKSKILDSEFQELKETLPNNTNTKYNTFTHNRDWDLHTRKNVLKGTEIAILNGSKKEI